MCYNFILAKEFEIHKILKSGKPLFPSFPYYIYIYIYIYIYLQSDPLRWISLGLFSPEESPILVAAPCSILLVNQQLLTRDQKRQILNCFIELLPTYWTVLGLVREYRLSVLQIKSTTPWNLHVLYFCLCCNPKKQLPLPQLALNSFEWSR
jgi:hypothetical protein